MAGSDEEVEIRAQLRDEVSGPAMRASRSIDELGDEARETAVELEAMGAAADDAGDELNGLGRDADRASKRLNAQQRALKADRDELGRFTAATKEADKATDSLGDSTGNAGTKARKAGRDFGFFGNKVSRLMGLTKTIAKWGTIADGVLFLGTAVGGLGAAGYAAVAGLTPLTGMLVAYPGLLAAGVQSMVTFKLATSGMGDAISALVEGDMEKFNEASKNMSKNQIAFARAVAGSSKEWGGLKKELGSRFFDGLDVEFERMNRNYLPIMRRQLGQNADNWNFLAKRTSGYINSAQGIDQINTLLGTSNSLQRNMGMGLISNAKGLIGLLNAADPMLRVMGSDYRKFSADLTRDINNNQDKITAFFNRSYALYKRVYGSVGDYSKGLYNIGKSSMPLAGAIGGDLEKVGKDFRKWTDNPANQKKMRSYFTSMIPVVRELGHWIIDISSAVTDLQYTPKDFVSTSKTLRTELLPALVDIANFAKNKFVPAIGEVAAIYNDLRESGVGKGTENVLTGIFHAVQWGADKLAHAPDSSKKIMAFASTLVAAYFMLSKVGTVRNLLIKATGGRLGGSIQRVYVVNWPIGYGAGGGPGGRGAPGRGGPGRGGTTSRRRNGLPRVTGGGEPGRRRRTRTASERRAERMTRARELTRSPRVRGGAGIFGTMALAFAPTVSEKFTNKKVRNGGAPASSIYNGALSGGGLGMLGGPWGAAGGALLGAGFESQKYSKDALSQYKSFLRKMSSEQLKNEQRYQEKRLNKRKGGFNPYSGPSLTENQGARARLDAIAAQRRRNQYVSGGAAGAAAGAAASRAKPSKGNVFSNFASSLKLPKMPKTSTTKFSAPGLSKTNTQVDQFARNLKRIPPKKDVKTSAPGAPKANNLFSSIFTNLKKIKPNKSVKTSAPGAQSAAGTFANISRTIANIPNRKTITITAKADVGAAAAAVAGISATPQFSGGPTRKGQLYLGGELGPEAWIGRNGAMKMIGLNGPEFFKPGEGATVTASATADPFGGNSGNTPDWAVKSLQRASKAAMAGAQGSVSYGDTKVSVGPIYATDNVDVERAVLAAMRKAEQEREERK